MSLLSFNALRIVVFARGAYFLPVLGWVGGWLPPRGGVSVLAVVTGGALGFTDMLISNGEARRP